MKAYNVRFANGIWKPSVIVMARTFNDAVSKSEKHQRKLQKDYTGRLRLIEVAELDEAVVK